MEIVISEYCENRIRASKLKEMSLELEFDSISTNCNDQI